MNRHSWFEACQLLILFCSIFFQVGDVMIIRDHVSFLGLAGIHPLVGHNDARFGPRFPAQGSAVYAPELQACCRRRHLFSMMYTNSPLSLVPTGHSSEFCCSNGPLECYKRGRLHGRFWSDVRVPRRDPHAARSGRRHRCVLRFSAVPTST